MIPVSVIWLAPIVFALVVAVRSFDDVVQHGLGALPQSFTFENFAIAWSSGQARAMWNSAVITVPTVVLTLLLSSMAAFALSRYEVPFRRAVLALLLAGNLLPPQVLLVPVTKMTENLGIYDTLAALILVHTGFNIGFYTFVLHGFMRMLPGELTAAAVLDGASPVVVYWRIILPLVRPSLAGLAALAATWTFNDLIWAISVIRTGDLLPVSAMLLNFTSQYVNAWNVVTAGAILAAIPTAAVFFAFQKHFVSGLLMGSAK